MGPLRWIFFRKYIGKMLEICDNLKNHFFSSLLNCKNAVYNKCNIQNMYLLIVDVTGKASNQQEASSKVLGE